MTIKINSVKRINSNLLDINQYINYSLSSYNSCYIYIDPMTYIFTISMYNEIIVDNLCFKYNILLY